jgi:HK97 family phage major capsid protein/HK97 family phage prohead protease
MRPSDVGPVGRELLWAWWGARLIGACGVGIHAPQCSVFLTELIPATTNGPTIATTAMYRAYSLLTVKSVDHDQRVITGLATTPTPDRDGDIVEPLGVKFRNPLKLLLHHDIKMPVGRASFGKATAEGLPFTASFPEIAEEGVLKTRVDEAWHSVKYGLLTGVSIGFRPQPNGMTARKSGGWHFTATEVFELSLVTIPANAEATIHTIKSLDAVHLAASGIDVDITDPPAGVPARRVSTTQKPTKHMTIQEQIKALEATRHAKVTKMTEIMDQAAENGETLDTEQTETYDTLALEVKSADGHLTRLADMDKLNIAKAVPVETHGVVTMPRITIKPTVEKGTAFARMCMALGAGRGDSYQTLQYAKQWNDSTPEVEQMIQHMWQTKAAVAVGVTTDATWAGPLVVTQPINEFLELLRPRTLLGRIPGMRQVPFNVSVPTQTTGGTYGWVGQNKPKPVTKADFSTVTVPFAKAAGIIVLSEELVKLSTPSAETLVREEMIAGMAQFLDGQFQDPAVAAVAGVNPASITNGASTAAASGPTSANAKADLAGRIATFTAAGIPLAGSVWLMNDSNAFALSVSVNALGQPLFPTMSAQGGTLFGMPVVISNTVGTRIILMHAPSILYADEGGVRIDVSREASVQMDSSPSDVVDATTVYISLWQRNLVGLRAERMITWIRARTAAVTYLTSASYTGA